MPHSTCGFLLVYGSIGNSLTSIFSVDVISCILAHGAIHSYDYQLTILFLTAAMHHHLLLCYQGLWGLMKFIVTYNIYPIVYIPLDGCRGKDFHRKSSVSYSNFLRAPGRWFSSGTPGFFHH